MSPPETSHSPEMLLSSADWIRRLAGSLVRDEATADDLVQDAHVAALRHPPRRALAWRSWVGRVLRNGAQARHRAETNRRRREVACARPEATETDPHLLVERAELQKRLLEQVLALAEPYRSTILLCFFEGNTPAEIAAVQRAPVTTVRTRIATALAQLRCRLDRASGGDREAWRVPLLPVAGLGSAVALGGEAAAAAAPGAGVAASNVWWTAGGWIMTQKALGVGVAGIVTLVAGISVGARWPARGHDARAFAALQGEHDRAVARLRELEGRSAAREQGWRRLVEAMQRTGKETPAPPEAPDRPAPEPNPTAVDVMATLRGLLEAGEPDPGWALAAEDLENTLAKHGRRPALLVAAALLCTDPETARAYIEEALAQEPDSPTALLALLDLERAAGDHDAMARTIAALAAVDPANALPHCYLAELKLKQGDLPGALAAVQDALARPRLNNYDAGRVHLLEAFHRDSGQPESVARVLSMMGTRLEELPLLRDVARGLSGEANRLFLEGDAAGALRYAGRSADLGAKLSASAHSLVEEMVGLFMTREALLVERGVRSQGDEGGRVQEIDAVLELLKSQEKRSRTIAQSYLPVISRLDEAQVMEFFNRIFADGESAAAIQLPAVREALERDARE